MSDCNNVLFVATTNRPEDFDSPFRRRFQTMIYVGLPTAMERFLIIKQYLKGILHWVTDSEIKRLAQCTKDYSPADLNNLLYQATDYCFQESIDAEYVVVKEQYLTPTHHFDKDAEPMEIAKIKYQDTLKFRPNPLKLKHINDALRMVKATMDPLQVEELLKFKNQFAPDSFFNIKEYKRESFGHLKKI